MPSPHTAVITPRRPIARRWYVLGILCWFIAVAWFLLSVAGPLINVADTIQRLPVGGAGVVTLQGGDDPSVYAISANAGSVNSNQKPDVRQTPVVKVVGPDNKQLPVTPITSDHSSISINSFSAVNVAKFHVPQTGQYRITVTAPPAPRAPDTSPGRPATVPGAPGGIPAIPADLANGTVTEYGVADLNIWDKVRTAFIRSSLIVMLGFAVIIGVFIQRSGAKRALRSQQRQLHQ